MTASNELFVVHLEERVSGGEKLGVEDNLKKSGVGVGGREREEEREKQYSHARQEYKVSIYMYSTTKFFSEFSQGIVGRYG